MDSIQFKEIKKKSAHNEELRVLPHDLEIEGSVLSTLLSSPKAILEVANIIQPAFFYSESNREISTAILELFGNNKPYDISAIHAYLVKSNKSKSTGGNDYLKKIAGYPVSVESIEYNCRTLQSMHVQRRVIEFTEPILHKAFDISADAGELISQMETFTMNINNEVLGTVTDSMNQQVDEYIEEVAIQCEMGIMPGIPSPFPEINDLIGNFQPGTNNIIAARPGMGKTAFALEILLHVAYVLHKPVALYSYEMNRMQMFSRIASCLLEIPLEKITKRKLSKDDINRIKDVLKKVAKYLHFKYCPSWGVKGLKRNATRLVKEFGVEMIGIDYIQLVPSLNPKANRETQVSEISRELKNMAGELHVPLLNLCQVGRESEKRKDQKPTLADLRESGSLEQDADSVMFIYRPEYYDRPSPIEHLAEIIIAKNRNGSMNKNVDLLFFGDIQKFRQNITQEKIDFSNINDELTF